MTKKMNEKARSQIQEHCNWIIQDRRYKNRIVVICEGNKNNVHSRTVQQYRQLDHIPDANFYINAVPRWWINKPPKFIPSGGRSDVLKTFKMLRDMHLDDTLDTYLKRDNIFALVDLDLQSESLLQTCENIETTEALFKALYLESKQPWSPEETHILCTGWLHKECYFFEPELSSDLFFLQEATYQQTRLQLSSIYQDMIEDLTTCQDLTQNLNVALRRLPDSLSSIFSDIQDLRELQSSFRQWWSEVEHLPQEQRELIDALFRVKKAKDYWRKLGSDKMTDIQQAKDQWTLDIAKFYSKTLEKGAKWDDLRYHIHQWMLFLWLHHNQSPSTPR